MNSYIIAPEAMSDLEQIIDYLAMDNVNKGENFLNEFNKKCRYLTQFPMMGRSYREIRSYLRDLPMKKHITALCVFKTYNNSSGQNNCGDEQTRSDI